MNIRLVLLALALVALKPASAEDFDSLQFKMNTIDECVFADFFAHLSSQQAQFA